VAAFADEHQIPQVYQTHEAEAASWYVYKPGA
jgi:hypothetical protein